MVERVHSDKNMVQDLKADHPEISEYEYPWTKLEVVREVPDDLCFKSFTGVRYV